MEDLLPCRAGISDLKVSFRSGDRWSIFFRSYFPPVRYVGNISRLHRYEVNEPGAYVFSLKCV